MSRLISFFDTATEPDDAMRDAMRAAAVGDDVYRRDPTVSELQARAAALLRKEDALFMPSGTMGNLAAIMTHTRRGAGVVLGAESHIARAETGGLAAVAGCTGLEVTSADGVLDPTEVEVRLEPPDEHRPEPQLLCVENSHNRGGGTVTPPSVMHELRAICERWHLRLHVDGARLLNAAVALELEPADLVADADSAMLSLDKGLGAPIGALLIGTHEFIEAARRIRKMLGGGMRQVGVVAAAGLVALENWRSRLAEDHHFTQLLAKRLGELPGLVVSPVPVPTNIVLCDVSAGGVGVQELTQRLLADRVACSISGPSRLRFVVHNQIREPEIEHLCHAIKGAMKTP